MRGKAHCTKLIIIKMRITTAYAGKRGLPHGADFVSGDHPRLCGEKADGYVVASDVEGSPPPMRGKAAACGFGCKV